MSSTSARPAVDVTAHRRPALHVLAFVLGLLAVPGSTIAWDLPAGGVWIGLPLALGAPTPGPSPAAQARLRRCVASRWPAWPSPASASP